MAILLTPSDVGELVQLLGGRVIKAYELLQSQLSTQLKEEIEKLPSGSSLMSVTQFITVL